MFFWVFVRFLSYWILLLASLNDASRVPKTGEDPHINDMSGIKVVGAYTTWTLCEGFWMRLCCRVGRTGKRGSDRGKGGSFEA